AHPILFHLHFLSGKCEIHNFRFSFSSLQILSFSVRSFSVSFPFFRPIISILKTLLSAFHPSWPSFGNTPPARSSQSRTLFFSLFLFVSLYSLNLSFVFSPIMAFLRYYSARQFFAISDAFSFPLGYLRIFFRYFINSLYLFRLLALSASWGRYEI